MSDFSIAGWNAHDYGFAAWAYDPRLATDSLPVTLVQGTQYFTDIKVGNVPFQNVFVPKETATVTPKQNEALVFVYDRDTGILIASQEITVVQLEVASAVEKIVLPSQVVVPSGVARVGICLNGQKAAEAGSFSSLVKTPKINQIEKSTTLPGGKLLRSGTGATALKLITSLPANFPAPTASEFAVWFGLS